MQLIFYVLFNIFKPILYRITFFIEKEREGKRKTEILKIKFFYRY